MISISQIEMAQRRLDGITIRTPLGKLASTPAFNDNQVFAKLESLQITGAFKIRGAYNKLSSLISSEVYSEALLKSGVVSFSSGNHASGVAYAAKLLNIKSTIVMPEFSIKEKIEAVRSYGSNVIVYGKSSMESAARAAEIEAKDGFIFIHPFDDPEVIAGQGTIGLEIMEDMPDVDLIISPVSGGGLISGVSLAAKQALPKIRIIGVQPFGSAAMYESVKQNQLVELDSVKTVADGLTAKKVGPLTLEIVKEYVDEIVLVSEDEIEEATKLLAFNHGILAEPSAAVTVAALLFGRIQVYGKKVIVIISGRNIAIDYLSQIVNKILSR